MEFHHLMAYNLTNERIKIFIISCIKTCYMPSLYPPWLSQIIKHEKNTLKMIKIKQPGKTLSKKNYRRQID